MLGHKQDVPAILERLRAVPAARADVAHRPVTQIALMALGIGPGELPELAPGSLASASPLVFALSCLKEDAAFTPFARESDHSTALLEACGWAGEPALVSVLLGAMASGNEKRAAAAALSLERITGLHVAAERPPGTAGEKAPRSLSLDPERWRERLDAAGTLQHGAKRLRHGAAWHRGTAVAHLRRPECRTNERLIAAWEHALIHEAGFPAHPEQFVELQRAELDASVNR
jgi:hypothetical protein